MKRILVVSPHPDDETLACGGTLLKHKSSGDEIHWLIMTSMSGVPGYSNVRRKMRDLEIRKVRDLYGFSTINSLRLPTTQLDALPLSEIIGKVDKVFSKVKPEQVYLPFPGDVHSDHRVSFEASSACVKWFRHPSVRSVLCYETLSETEMGIRPDTSVFRPNLFVDISGFLDKKIEIFNAYKGESGAFPFSRSAEAIRALAMYRGSMAGCKYAESFMLVKSVV